MPINAHPDYLAAEKEYLGAQTLEEKIEKLKKMISVAPSHKGAENLRAQLKTRLKKLKEQLEKSKKSGRKTSGIKKENHQIVILGKTNSGKSSLLNLLTNTKEKISEIPFTTIQPLIGISTIENVAMQIIENPAIDSENYDKGLTNSADALILLINKLENLNDLEPFLQKATKKQIIIYNDKEKMKDLRKLQATMKSKKLNFVIMNLKNPREEKIKELENKLFKTFDKIRVYTKEPSKDKSNKPIVMKKESTVYDIAEKILKGFSKKIKQAKIWGPSSKFPGQIVGLKHKLKDLDVVEFKTK